MWNRKRRIKHKKGQISSQKKERKNQRKKTEWHSNAEGDEETK